MTGRIKVLTFVLSRVVYILKYSIMGKVHYLEHKFKDKIMRVSHKTSLLIIVAFLSLSTIELSAQRIAVKSNILQWATATPNIGLELGVSQRLTLDLTYGINPFTFENNKKWKHWIVQPELRYWFCERFYGHFLGLHLGGGEYNLSRVKIPTVKNSQNYRYEGWDVLGGISYGYSWILGKRWNLEATLGLGVIHTNYERFECPDCGRHIENGKSTFFSPTKAGVSIIYMLK